LGENGHVLGLVERASEVFGFVSLIGTLREEIKSGPKKPTAATKSG
jgi:hypothetical protein